MRKFLVLYLAPVSVLEEWKKTDPEKRKAAEAKMQGEWRRWMSGHAKALADKGAGVGKTKRVTAQGTSDTRNEIMLYAIEGHPHLQIPQSSIEIMEVHPLSGM